MALLCLIYLTLGCIQRIACVRLDLNGCRHLGVTPFAEFERPSLSKFIPSLPDHSNDFIQVEKCLFQSRLTLAGGGLRISNDLTWIIFCRPFGRCGGICCALLACTRMVHWDDDDVEQLLLLVDWCLCVVEIQSTRVIYHRQRQSRPMAIKPTWRCCCFSVMTWHCFSYRLLCTIAVNFQLTFPSNVSNRHSQPTFPTSIAYC